MVISKRSRLQARPALRCAYERGWLPKLLAQLPQLELLRVWHLEGSSSTRDQGVKATYTGTGTVAIISRTNSCASAT
jgi:hypothetical protein